MPEAKTPRAAKKGSIQHHKKRGTLAKKDLNLPKEPVVSSKQKNPSTLAYYMYDSTYDIYWQLDDNGNWNDWDDYWGFEYAWGKTPYDYGWTGPEEGDAATSTDSYDGYYGDEATSDYTYYDYKYDDYYYSYTGAA
jgi:hypothetical protein